MTVLTTQVDQIDLKILSALQKNAALSNRAISELVGISPPSCLRRTKELKNSGFLTGAHASINGSLLNLDLIIYCDIMLENHTPADIMQFVQSINVLPYIRECYLVTGLFDFLLKIIVPNINAYTDFLTKSLIFKHNVLKVTSRMVVQTRKKEVGIPIESLLTI